MPSFGRSTGFLLSQLGTLSRRAWLDVLGERDLTPHQHAVLLSLHEEGRLTLVELAQRTLVDPRNMGPVLTPLEERGLLTRERDPQDARRRPLTLSASGRGLAAELAAATAQIEDALLQPLDEEERAALQRSLQRLWEDAKRPS